MFDCLVSVPNGSGILEISHESNWIMIEMYFYSSIVTNDPVCFSEVISAQNHAQKRLCSRKARHRSLAHGKYCLWKPLF